MTNAGQLEPGTSPGTLEIVGALEQQTSGRIMIELGGLLKGAEYDTISVGGTASLAGKLQVELIDLFSPSDCD